MEPEDVIDFLQVVGRIAELEVFLFLGIALDFEAQEAVHFVEVVDDDIVAVVLVLTGADLHLL